MTFNSIMSYIYFAYGMVFIHFAFIISLMREKKRIHFLGLALLLDYGTLCLSIMVRILRGFEGTGANLVWLTSMVAIAPIASSLILECLGEYETHRQTRTVIAAGSLVLWIGILAGTAFRMPRLAMATCVIGWHSAVLACLATREGLALYPFGKMSSGLFAFFCGVVADAALITISFIFMLIREFFVADIFCVFLLLSILALFLHAVRSPETYRNLRMDVESIRSLKNAIPAEFSAEVCRRLDGLMHSDRIFLDPELSLDALANKVSQAGRRMNGEDPEFVPIAPVRANQLSAIINANLGGNFSAYVNAFRIAYAKELLSTGPGDSVIEIALNCGFNSKSVFNARFRKETGMTPTEYRRTHAAGQ